MVVLVIGVEVVTGVIVVLIVLVIGVEVVTVVIVVSV